jgi:hypothetical protein
MNQMTDLKQAELDEAIDALRKLYEAIGGLSGKYPRDTRIQDVARRRAHDLIERHGASLTTDF